MAVYGMAATKDPFPAFCNAYQACVKAWGSDPAYASYRFQIDQAIRGLSLLEASPGMRAAYQRPGTTPTGQAAPPKEEPSAAQSEEANEPPETAAQEKAEYKLPPAPLRA